MRLKPASWHDYKLPGMYMMTFTLNPGIMNFSTVNGTPKEPQLELTRFGVTARELLRDTIKRLPGVYLWRYVFMPDHLHIVITVTKPLSRSIRTELAIFKKDCSQAYFELLKADEFVSVFRAGIHDRIIFDQEMLENELNYISDNPRRLLVKREMPGLFTRYLHLDIAGVEMAAYGNMFLLRDLQKMAVMVHRASTAEEKGRDRARWLACADNGGVLVSPFISPEEREIRDVALKLGGRIIELRPDGMPERFKPSGREFELCRQGRVLLLAPWPDNREHTVTRTEALTLNFYATNVAALGAEPVALRDYKGYSAAAQAACQ